MPSTTIAGPHPTVSAHEYILGECMIADLALQGSSIPPSPLRVSMMLASDIFVVSQSLHDAIECMLAVCNIGMLRNLLIHSLVCHCGKPVLVPKWASASFPGLTAIIAKFSTAASKRLAPAIAISRWKNADSPTGDMIAPVLELYHGTTVEATLPILSIGNLQNIMKCIIHRAVNTRMCK